MLLAHKGMCKMGALIHKIIVKKKKKQRGLTCWQKSQMLKLSMNKHCFQLLGNLYTCLSFLQGVHSHHTTHADTRTMDKRGPCTFCGPILKGGRKEGKRKQGEQGRVFWPQWVKDQWWPWQVRGHGQRSCSKTNIPAWLYYAFSH